MNNYFNLDMDLDMDMDMDFDKANENKSKQIKNKSLKMLLKKQMYKAYTEVNLLNILPHDVENGYSYHCISAGDIDSMSYLKYLVRQQNIDYLLFSTWCMSLDDVYQIRDWISENKIKRFDAYCGEIFPGSYRDEFDELKILAHSCGGRVAIFRNHSKIMAGTGKKFSFAVESSANLNTNPRTENTTVIIDTELYKFYKDFYDEIIPFNNKDFKNWERF